MDRLREGEGPPVFFIEVAVMIAQQKALDGNAVSSDACEANRRALSRVQQNDCVVGTQRNDVLFWIGRNAFKATAPSVRRFFSCSLKNSQPGWSN